MDGRDKAANQLTAHKLETQKTSSATTSYGSPMIDINASMTVGTTGYIPLQDIHLLDILAHFERERIPERVVHAKGGGAFGHFTVTHDITQYTAAKVFESIGKKTNVAARFSTVGGESGSADTARDPRGFAIKFYTEDGNWDLVGNNTPIFFIRDPILFPSFIHTQKRNPVTHLKDADMFWDFMTLRQETTHQLLFLFSDRGIPDGFRHMNGYGSHTFKMINAKQQAYYCKFHFKTDQKIKCLDAKKADELAGTDPDYSIRDLYNAIANEKYPSWTLYIQIMTLKQAEECKFNPFDVTKVWPQGDYPLKPVGKLVLDRNPSNYFAEVEQIAFSPSHMIPGIEPSPDRMLQGRLFAYPDTHRHRLGANYLQFPVNCPFNVRNYQRDGPQAIHNQGGAPNYFPNSFSGPGNDERAKTLASSVPVSGDISRYDNGDEDNYTQSKVFYQKVLKDDERERLIANMADSLKNAADFIQERALKNLKNVDESLVNRLAIALKNYRKPHANL